MSDSEHPENTLNPTKLTGNVFIIGPMGVGKTTVGRQLAQTLKREFKDSDREIEEHTGANIPLIFELEGEEGFRKRESDTIDQLTQSTQLVLATGGGAILRPENRECLRQRGHVIYLYATVEQLLKRTRHSKNRPLLQTDDPEARITQILKERTPLYESIADLSIETGKQTVKTVVSQICAWLKTQETPQA